MIFENLVKWRITKTGLWL